VVLHLLYSLSYTLARRNLFGVEYALLISFNYSVYCCNSVQFMQSDSTETPQFVLESRDGSQA
jgi:hypothetical protein